MKSNRHPNVQEGTLKGKQCFGAHTCQLLCNGENKPGIGHLVLKKSKPGIQRAKWMMRISTVHC